MSGPPAAGERFAGYLIEAELGRGGMGVVYRARDERLDRIVALKVISPALSGDDRFAERFRREARLAAAVEHPAIVPVYGSGEEAGRLYLAMRLIDGSDLAAVLAGGPLAPERVAAIASGLAGGLDAAHAAGLVHRDVKPANVLLAGPEGGGAAFLTDFGISRQTARAVRTPEADTERALTATGELIGSADYLAPEQIEEGVAGPASDLYSLACTTFEALTGEPPFRRPTAIATLMAHTRAERPRPSALRPELPAAADEVLATAMAIDPAARPPSASAFAGELRQALLAPPDPVPTAAAARRRPARRPAVLGVVLVALAAAAVAAGLVLAGGGGEDGPGGEGGSTAASAADPGQDEQAREPRVRSGPVGSGPVGIAVGELSTWVAARDADRLDALALNRPKPDRVAVPIEAPTAVDVAFGSIWALAAGNLVRLDPGEGTDQLVIETGEDPAALTHGDGSMWVADAAGNEVLRVDPATNTVVSSTPVGDEPRALAAGAGGIWVASAGAGTVSEIDTSSNDTVGRPIEAGGRPTSIATGLGSVWVTDNLGGTLIRIDPDAGVVAGEPVLTGTKPRGVVVGSGSVWTADGGDDTVSRFDAEGNRVGETIPVGDEPAEIAAGAGAIWTANFGDSTVSRIAP